MARDRQNTKHGTNIMDLRQAANRGSVSTAAAYDIANSVCFIDNVIGTDSSDWMKATNDCAHSYPGGPVSHEYTSIKIATFSFWLKRGQLSSGPTISGGPDESMYSNFNSAREGKIQIDDDSRLKFYFPLHTADSPKIGATLNDYSSWYHIVVAMDTTDGTAANRLKVYINGVEQTWSTAPNMDQDDSIAMIGHGPSWFSLGAG